MPLLDAISLGLHSQSKDYKDDGNNAPGEAEAITAATSITKPGATVFGPPLTQRVGDKTTAQENEDKDSEDESSAGSSCKEDVSETEKDSANLVDDTPPARDKLLVDGEQSHASVVVSPRHFKRYTDRPNGGRHSTNT